MVIDANIVLHCCLTDMRHACRVGIIVINFQSLPKVFTMKYILQRQVLCMLCEEDVRKVNFGVKHLW